MKANNFSISQIFKTAGNELEGAKWPCLVPVLTCLIPYAFLFIAVLVALFSAVYAKMVNDYKGEVLQHIFLPSMVIGGIAALALIFLLPLKSSGIYWVALRRIRHEPISGKTSFEIFRKYFRLFGFILLISILAVLVCGALFFPFRHGPYQGWMQPAAMLIASFLAPFLLFGIFSVLEGNKVFASIKRIWPVTLKNFLKIWIFTVMTYLLNLLGIITIVGWIWLFPLTALGWAALYQQLFSNK